MQQTTHERIILTLHEYSAESSSLTLSMIRMDGLSERLKEALSFHSELMK
jgi:hypothetical protein